MRIAIDATPVVARRKGIGVVLEGLISAIKPGSLLSTALLFVDETIQEDATKLWPHMELESVSMRSSLWYESVQLPRLLSRRGTDAFLTLRERTLVPRGTRSVVWLFEDPRRREALARHTPGRSLGQKLVGWHAGARLARVARRTDRFIVSSAFTRDDLVRSYGVNEARISILHPGLSPAFSDASVNAAIPHAAGGHRYVLHFATGDPRDNTEVAMRAFASATTRFDTPVHLVLAGVPDKLRTHLTRLGNILGIGARLHLHGYIAAANMPALYAEAAVYLDPTLFEGFGLQIIEAMAAGTPVVSSNVSSVPEVAGGVAILCDPSDPESLAHALMRVLSDETESARLSGSGRERAELFRWDVTAASVERIVGSL